jgi:hypothetical protein
VITERGERAARQPIETFQSAEQLWVIRDPRLSRAWRNENSDAAPSFQVEPWRKHSFKIAAPVIAHRELAAAEAGRYVAAPEAPECGARFASHHLHEDFARAARSEDHEQ